MRRWLKRITVGLLLLLLIAVIFVASMAGRTKLPGEGMTPAGIRQRTSFYLTMRDGVQIAVTLFLPPELQLKQRVPALMRTTRYWRAPQLGWGMRLMLALHRVRPQDLVDKQRDYFNRRGFAVLLVDARGSGASFGHRVVEYSPAEVADMGEVAAWAARQPWSNGRIGTFGVSYEGDTAELAAVPNQPAIRAVMPLYDDFDNQALIQPGGVALRGFLQQWSDLVSALDRDDVCAADHVRGLKCWWERRVVPGVEQVDADRGRKQLAAAVAQHQNLNVAEATSKAEFRDDVLTTTEGTFRFMDISPYGLRRQIEASGVPMMVWCGWMDASPCEGALIRYRTFTNPQVVIIGPLSHGGNFNADPFAASHRPPVPTRPEQFKMEADFFDQLLRSDSPKPIESMIRYYTMGEGAWHTTRVWPPERLAPQKL